MKEKENDKKTMDVARLDKPSPDISGRPLLINHRPIVQDPMVKQLSEIDETDKVTKKEVVSRTSKTVQPLGDSPSAAPLKTEARDSEAEALSDEAAVVGAVAEQADTKTKLKEGELSQEDQAKQARIQKLVADKTYFVPTGQVARRRANRRAVLVLMVVIVLALAAVYLLIDAGIIRSSIKLPIHLIKS